MSDTWKVVKDFYKNQLNIEGLYVDLQADIEIVSLCAYGFSNANIGLKLDMEDTCVAAVLSSRVADFVGWETDLQFIPVKLFYSTQAVDVSAHYLAYKRKVGEYNVNNGVSYKSFLVCTVAKLMKDKIYSIGGNL